jgi:hypothetical protein
MQQLVALMLTWYLCHSYTQLNCSVSEVKALPRSTLRSSVLHLSPLPQNWPADTYLLWFLNFPLIGERGFELRAQASSSTMDVRNSFRWVKWPERERLIFRFNNGFPTAEVM